MTINLPENQIVNLATKLLANQPANLEISLPANQTANLVQLTCQQTNHQTNQPTW
jgi:hypothetical protein